MKRIVFSCPEDLHGRLREVADETGLGIQGVMLLTLRRAGGMPGSTGNFGVLTAPRKQNAPGVTERQNTSSEEAQMETEEMPRAEQMEGSTGAAKQRQDEGQIQADDARTTISEDGHDPGNVARTQAGDDPSERSEQAPRALDQAATVEASRSASGDVSTAPAAHVEQVPASATPPPTGSQDSRASEGTPQPAAGGLKEPRSESESEGSPHQPKATTDPRPTGTPEQPRPAQRPDQRRASTGLGQSPPGSGQKAKQSTAGAMPVQQRPPRPAENK